MYPDAHAGVSLDQGVDVTRLSRRGFPLVRMATNRGKFARTLRQLHEAHPIDIIEGGEMEFWVLTRSLPGKKVLRMHGGPTFFETGIKIQAWKERWSFHVAEHLCAVSNAVAQGTRRLLNLRDRPIEVIPNPIDTSLFVPGSQDVPEDDGLIVFAGTIADRKGIRELIQAMPRIVREVPHARLEVYGGEVIDPAPPEPLSQKLIRSMPPEVAARVAWKGRVDRGVLQQEIRRASVCVYPSHMEAMPMAWLEGMAAGKPMVVSNTGPGPEIFDDGVTGLLCDPHDPESIAQQIVRLLKDEPLRRRLGSAARTAAVERYSIEKIVERNLSYYESLAS
jgi:glycosyltransferase involved in cell wall biosynthesis